MTARRLTGRRKEEAAPVAARSPPRRDALAGSPLESLASVPVVAPRILSSTSGADQDAADALAAKTGGGAALVPTLSDSQVAAIVFNETRSISGSGIDRARANVANAVINGDRTLGARRPMTGPTTANVPPAELTIYANCTAAVATARSEQTAGTDPTAGSVHFNLRRNSATGPFQGHALTTQSGPFTNSYPTAVLPASGIYINTYV